MKASEAALVAGVLAYLGSVLVAGVGADNHGSVLLVLASGAAIIAMAILAECELRRCAIAAGLLALASALGSGALLIAGYGGWL